MAMTAWDTVMDPGMARSGAWTWEHGGAYFGVPEHNFAGWLATTLTVYAAAELAFRCLGSRPVTAVASLYAGLPIFAYALVAADRVLLPSLPELRVVAAFGMGLVAVLALLRLSLERQAVSSPEECGA
jgi:putative membrane protein